MKRFIVLGLLATTGHFLYAQHIDNIIDTAEVKRIATILSADDMEGRRIFTPGIDKAANFIASEFNSAGLQAVGEPGDFGEGFFTIRSRVVSASVVLDGKSLSLKNVNILSSDSVLKVNEFSGYQLVRIKSDDNFYKDVLKYLQAREHLIILVDPHFRKNLSEIASSIKERVKSKYNKIFIVAERSPSKYNIEVTQRLKESKLFNVIGILPGKSRVDEFVVFSAHYDHVGVGPAVDGDRIYNGANDDASGVTAIITLAKYFKELNNNERTLIFAAFTGEEYGLFGSEYFSSMIDPAKVIAMFNIEMIGTKSKWGKNAAYITGYDKTNMGRILQRNLKGTDFTFYPDPYYVEQIFYRSDNITLARLGVPAHTIMTAKMDNEPNYHKPSDEIGTLDILNMTMIIKAIALSAGTIVEGRDSPSRVDVSDLR